MVFGMVECQELFLNIVEPFFFEISQVDLIHIGSLPQKCALARKTDAIKTVHASRMIA